MAQQEGLAQQQTPVVPVAPVVPSPPAHTPAREAQPPPLQPDLDVDAPLCGDCGWRIDTPEHTATCEDAHIVQPTHEENP